MAKSFGRERLKPTSALFQACHFRRRSKMQIICAWAEAATGRKRSRKEGVKILAGLCKKQVKPRQLY